MLPNVLVIGAQKSGTTTVWHALNKHPDVFMSPQREIGFFSHDHVFNRGAAFYERSFFSGWNGERICGEKTPEYLLMPDAPARIGEVLGNSVKLIVLLRNPMERAYSGYRHSLMLGLESLLFDDALAAEPERIARNASAVGRFGYLTRGYYARQLANYLKVFPRDNLFIALFDDLVRDQNAVFADICKFIGVEPIRFAEPIDEGKSRVEKIPVDAAANIVTYKSTVIKGASAQMMAFVRDFNRAVDALKPLSREQVADMNRKYFQDDINALSRLLGRDLGFWLDA